MSPEPQGRVRVFVRNYSEVIHRYSADGKSVYRDHYSQPLFNHAVYRLYHAYDQIIWKFPGIMRFEWFLHRRHDKTCNGDCSVGYQTDGTAVPVCGYIPLTNRQDLRCFDLHHKNRVHLREELIAEAT